MKALSWINVMLGVWLIAAAFIFARTGPVMADESVAGIAIAVLAYASSVARPSAGISWSVAVAGLWTLIMNFGDPTPAKINAMVVGLVVFILGTVNAVHRHVPVRSRL